jgi:ketosteroid isomerase-like protein
MKTFHLIALGLFVLNAPAQVRPTAAHDKAAVLEAERAGCLAYQQNSAEGVRKFLMDDYTLTDSHGTVTTKQDDLDDFEKERVHYTTFVNKNMAVRLYGDAAIVTGQTIVRGTAQGKPFDVEVQFTDTLLYEEGGWKLAAGHVSRLQQ